MKSLLTRRALSLTVLSALIASFAAPAIATPSTATLSTVTVPAAAKNIIVMIGDGMGYNHVATGDFYLFGTAGGSFVDMPFTAGVSTYSLGGGYYPAAAWASFDYQKRGATDSAAAATALATGVKTYDSAVSVNIAGEPVTTVLEAAEARGKATGVVTSVAFSHETPAAFATHNLNRSNYTAIAESMLRDSATDVIMGAGNPWYDENGEKRGAAEYTAVSYAMWHALLAGSAGGDADSDGLRDPWTLVQTRAEFRGLAQGDTPARVLGVAQAATTLQQGRSGDGYVEPYEVPLLASVPSLQEMTAGALNVLDEDPDGLVLMVEGGAIDLASHAGQTGRLVEEQIDFVNAVDTVKSWVEQHSTWDETLLIVVGDHETGYLTGPGSGESADGPVWSPLFNLWPMTPAVQWNSLEHTNALTPLFAKGAASARLAELADERDPVRGAYLDNTEIADVIFALLEQ